MSLSTITLTPYIRMIVFINIFSSETRILIEHKLFYPIIGWSLTKFKIYVDWRLKIAAVGAQSVLKGK